MRSTDIPAPELQKHDAIIYLAGLSSRASCDARTWEEVYAMNVLDVCTVASKLSESQLLVYASSASVVEGYADPVTEACCVNELALDAYAKSMHERERALAKLNKRAVGLRFGTCIGVSPSQRYDLLHVAMARDAVRHGVVHVTNGDCKRGILSLRDLGRAVAAILTQPHLQGHEVYHVASFNTTITKAAQCIAAEVGATLDFSRTTPHVGFALDTTKFETNFNFSFLSTNRDLACEMHELFTRATTPCRVCQHQNMRMIVDLGHQPLANNYVPEPCKQPTYPLVLTRCTRCSHTQLDFTMPPTAMFSTYQYVSGTSSTLRAYFAWLASDLTERHGAGRVLELACNDGCQLDEFARRGWETYGVDPASNIVPIAREKGHTVFCSFWGTDPNPPIPVPDVIVAQNVLAHVPDPIAFLRACASAMGPRTTLYIQTSQCEMYQHGEFDTVYHEHVSFFTAASMARAASESGLCIVQARKTPIHGTSFLMGMRLMPCAPHPCAGPLDHHHDSLLAMVQQEHDQGLYSDEFYRNYRRQVHAIRDGTRNIVRDLQQQGYAVAAFGAAAKGMTLLNVLRLENIEYIVDDAPTKQGLYTPGTNIPICAPTKLSEDARPLALLVLAWNFADEIKHTVRTLRSAPAKLIVPFPTMQVLDLC